MTARPQPLDRLERESIRLCAVTLEKRAQVSSRVVVSDRFAKQVARYLRRLLEGQP